MLQCWAERETELELRLRQLQAEGEREEEERREQIEHKIEELREKDAQTERCDDMVENIMWRLKVFSINFWTSTLQNTFVQECVLWLLGCRGIWLGGRGRRERRRRSWQSSHASCVL